MFSSGLPVVIGLILFAVVGASIIKSDFKKKPETMIDQARKLAKKRMYFFLDNKP